MPPAFFFVESTRSRQEYHGRRRNDSFVYRRRGLINRASLELGALLTRTISIERVATEWSFFRDAEYPRTGGTENRFLPGVSFRPVSSFRWRSRSPGGQRFKNGLRVRNLDGSVRQVSAIGAGSRTLLSERSSCNSRYLRFASMHSERFKSSYYRSELRSDRTAPTRQITPPLR